MGSILLIGSLLMADIAAASSSSSTRRFNPIENIFQPLERPRRESNVAAGTEKNTKFQIPYIADPNAPTAEEREAERYARLERKRQRLVKVASAMKKVRPDTSKIEKVSPEELNELAEEQPKEFRKLWGGGSGSSSNNNLIEYADPGDDYDMWQQAYRMLGGFIDCDHQKSEGSGDGGGDSGDNNGEQACSRWMMWASVSNRLQKIE
jgi:hypothetical protein